MNETTRQALTDLISRWAAQSQSTPSQLTAAARFANDQALDHGTPDQALALVQAALPACTAADAVYLLTLVGVPRQRVEEVAPHFPVNAWAEAVGAFQSFLATDEPVPLHPQLVTDLTRIAQAFTDSQHTISATVYAAMQTARLAQEAAGQASGHVFGDVVINDKIFAAALDPATHAAVPVVRSGLATLFAPPQFFIGHRDPYALLCTHYDTLADAVHPTGQIAMLAAPAGYGKRALARAVARYALTRGGTALVARFWPQQYLSLEDIAQIEAHDPLTKKFRQQAAQYWPEAVAAAGPTWQELLTQLNTILNRPLTPVRDELPDRPEALVTLLRRVARVAPLVLVLEDLEHASPGWLAALPRLAQDLVDGRRILLLLTIGTPDETGTMPNSQAGYLATYLHTHYAVPIIPLEPVAPSDITAWLGWAHPELSPRLFVRSKGIPAIIEGCWAEWVERELIDPSDQGFWGIHDLSHPLISDNAHQQAEALLHNLPEQCPYSKERVAQLLCCAAQEGPVFTIPALAQALKLDENELIRVLDTYLGPSGAALGLVYQASSVPGSDADIRRQLTRYQFASAYLYDLWRELEPETERQLLKRCLAEALEQTYQGLTDRVAPILIALFESTGQAERAKPYLRQQVQTASIQEIRWAIRYLHEQTDEHHQLQLADLHLALGARLRQAGNAAEATAQVQLALEIAQRWGDTAREAQALNDLKQNT